MEKESQYLIVDKATGETIGEIPLSLRPRSPVKSFFAVLLSAVLFYGILFLLGLYVNLSYYLLALIPTRSGWNNVLIVLAVVALVFVLWPLYKLGFLISYTIPEHIYPSPEGLRYYALSSGFALFYFASIVSAILVNIIRGYELAYYVSDLIDFAVPCAFAVYSFIRVRNLKRPKIYKRSV